MIYVACSLTVMAVVALISIAVDFASFVKLERRLVDLLCQERDRTWRIDHAEQVAAMSQGHLREVLRENARLRALAKETP